METSASDSSRNSEPASARTRPTRQSQIQTARASTHRHRVLTGGSWSPEQLQRFIEGLLPSSDCKADLDQLRYEFDARLAAVIVDHMNTAAAIGAYGERFNAMDARFDMLGARFDTVDRQFDTKIQLLSDKIDSRFGWQTAMFGGLGAVVLFADQLRGGLGL